MWGEREGCGCGRRGRGVGERSDCKESMEVESRWSLPFMVAPVFAFSRTVGLVSRRDREMSQCGGRLLSFRSTKYARIEGKGENPSVVDMQ